MTPEPALFPPKDDDESFFVILWWEAQTHEFNFINGCPCPEAATPNPDPASWCPHLQIALRIYQEKIGIPGAGALHD